MNKTQSDRYAYIEGERRCYRNFRQENLAPLGGVREGILAELTPTLTLKSSNVLVSVLWSEENTSRVTVIQLRIQGI